MQYDFRCKSCGHLHPAGLAGQMAHPPACRVCGGGRSFDPQTGTAKFDAANWEALADCPPERLTELGLTTSQVCRHERKTEAQTNTEDHARCVAEVANLEAKQAAWAANQTAAVAEWDRLSAKLTALADATEQAEVEELHRTRQAMKALEATEFTDRDAHHLATLRARVALPPHQRLPSGQGGTFHARKVNDGAGARQSAITRG